MALSIQTNYSSLVTQNQLTASNKLLTTAMQRLGTGMRINSAADDAAGLQIATRLQAQSNGQKVGMRNAQDAISMMQTAEGALGEMSDIVLRMKDLATQAANGTNSTDDTAAMDTEYAALAEELGNIMNNTGYGSGIKLLDATAGKFAASVTFQIGASSAETSAVDLSAEVTAVQGGVTAAATAGALATDASAEMDAMDTLLKDINTARAGFGANINRLDHSINNLANMKENTDVAKGRIMDADFAEETSSMTKNQMLMQAGMSVLSRSNQMGSLVSSLLQG